jgi:hypothetical protein
MIRFKDSVSYADPNIYMDFKINEFWNILNPRIKNGQLGAYSLCRKVDSLLNECRGNQYLSRVTNNDNNKQDRHVNYLEYLKDDNYYNLKGIVQSSPENLPHYIAEAFDILHSTDLTIRSKGVLKSHDFGKLLLDRVFNYKAFRSSQNCVNFYKRLGLERKHCFYCGSSEITVISKTAPTSSNYRDEHNRMLFDLDHFYLKSRYPFLSLSFYNLIPCCGICNSTYRGTKDFNIKTHINPFLDSFDENYYFSFDSAEIAKSLQEYIPQMQTLTLKRKTNAPKRKDYTNVDLELEHRCRANIANINNMLGEIMDYSHEGWERVAGIIHGYNDAKVPRSRAKILECSNAKMHMDFIDRIKVIFK